MTRIIQRTGETIDNPECFNDFLDGNPIIQGYNGGFTSNTRVLARSSASSAHSTRSIHRVFRMVGEQELLKPDECQKLAIKFFYTLDWSFGYFAKL